MEFPDEVEGGLHGAASGEQVVVEEHDVVGLDGVLMDFDGVLAILFRVGLLHGLGGELAGLPAERRKIYGFILLFDVKPSDVKSRFGHADNLR